VRREFKALFLGFGLAWVAACGVDPRRPFERMSPEVDKAISEIEAGKPEPASGRLGAYIGASRCDGGALAAPFAADAQNASFDLGLALFQLAEQFGRRFGDLAMQRDGGPSDEEKRLALLRGDQIDCARALLDAILGRDLPADLEARARYLRGNLAFLEGQWDAAIKDYDEALKIIPGLPPDAGDGVGADTAWNRALALRHKEEDDKKDAGTDADADADADGGDADADADADAPDGDADADAPDGDADADAPDGDADADAPPDVGPDRDSGDSGPEDGPKEAQGDGGDSGPDGGGGDAAGDAPSDGSKDKPSGSDAGDGDASAPSPTAPNQDDRVLDQFEQAPTWQKEEAKARASGRKVRGMQDK
jgi:tetratricopeptide (TPR) repeat protein